MRTMILLAAGLLLSGCPKDEPAEPPAANAPKTNAATGAASPTDPANPSAQAHPIRSSGISQQLGFIEKKDAARGLLAKPMSDDEFEAAWARLPPSDLRTQTAAQIAAKLPTLAAAPAAPAPAPAK